MSQIVQYNFGPLTMEADMDSKSFALKTKRDDGMEFKYVFDGGWVSAMARIGMENNYCALWANDEEGKRRSYIFANVVDRGVRKTIVGLPCGTMMVEKSVETLIEAMTNCCKMLDMDFSQV